MNAPTMNLVVQSLAPLAGTHIDTLRALSAARGCTTIDAHAVQLAVAPDDVTPERRVGIADFCQTHALDFAYVPVARLADYGLLAMDMDSTLITIECIDEIADFCGLKEQVAAITEASMRGEISDFRESLRRRVALLTGLDASVLERVYDERVQLSDGAEALLKGVKAAGLSTLLVSGGFTFFTNKLKARLGLDETHANTLEIVDGKLTGRVLGEIVDGAVKARHLADACKRLGIEPRRAIAMGDGSNDLPMMAIAGLSVAFRAKPVVRAGATVAFDRIGLDGVLKLFV